MRLGFEDRDATQRRIREHNIGRLALRPRLGAAPRSQALEEVGCVGRQIGRGGRSLRPSRLSCRPLWLAAQSNRAFALEHGSRFFGDDQSAVAIVGDAEDPLRKQLPNHRTPLGLSEFGADAKRRELLVLLLHHPVGLAAEQDVDELPCAVALAPLAVETHDRGEQFLGWHRAIP